MANKSNQPGKSKKPGKTLKEKRAATVAKKEAQSVTRKAWDNK
jgi:hypothetical protein